MASPTPHRLPVVRYALIALAAGALALAPQTARAQRGGGHFGGGGHVGGAGHFGGGHAGAGHFGGGARAGHFGAPVRGRMGTGPRVYSPPPAGFRAPHMMSFPRSQHVLGTGMAGASRGTPLGQARYHTPGAIVAGPPASSFHSRAGSIRYTPSHVTIGFPPEGRDSFSVLPPELRAGHFDVAGQGHHVWEIRQPRSPTVFSAQPRLNARITGPATKPRVSFFSSRPRFRTRQFAAPPRIFLPRHPRQPVTFTGVPFGTPFYFGPPFPYDFGYLGLGFGDFDFDSAMDRNPYSYPLGFGLWPACESWLTPGLFWTTGPCFGYGYGANLNPGYVLGFGAYTPYAFDNSILGFTGGTADLGSQIGVYQNDEGADAYGPFSWENPPADNSAGVNAESAAAEPTLLYLADGTNFAINYDWLAGGQLHYVTSYGAQDAVDLGSVDWQRTIEDNAARGVTFQFNTAPPDAANAPAAPLDPAQGAPRP